MTKPVGLWTFEHLDWSLAREDPQSIETITPRLFWYSAEAARKAAEDHIRGNEEPGQESLYALWEGDQVIKWAEYQDDDNHEFVWHSEDDKLELHANGHTVRIYRMTPAEEAPK